MSSKISVRPDLLDLAAIRADGVNRGFDSAISTIKSTPMAGLEPSTRGRTAAAVEYAAAMARAGASGAATQSREYRRRVALAYRADAGRLGAMRPMNWAEHTFSIATSTPDRWTIGSWLVESLRLPENTIKAHQKYELKKRQAAAAKGLEKRGMVDRVRTQLRGAKAAPGRAPGGKNAKVDPRTGGLRRPPLLKDKVLTGAKNAAPKAAKKVIPVASNYLTYRSAKDQGRSDADAAGKTAVSAAGGAAAGAAFGAGAGLIGGPFAPVTVPVSALVFGIGGSILAGAGYDVANPVKRKPPKMGTINWCGPARPERKSGRAVGPRS